jgi:Na+-translocating ferredoxin:NAD+ oxidoreductase RnfG subunit
MDKTPGVGDDIKLARNNRKSIGSKKMLTEKDRSTMMLEKERNEIEQQRKINMEAARMLQDKLAALD